MACCLRQEPALAGTHNALERCSRISWAAFSNIESLFFSTMAITRSLFKTVVRHTFEQLPDELLIEVLSNLSDRDLGAALCSSKRFSVLKEPTWRAVCAKRWPHWFPIIRSTQVSWKRQAELLSLRERELLVQPNQQAIQKTQTVVTPSNRAVLAEWLAEVTFGTPVLPSNCSPALQTAGFADDRWPLRGTWRHL
jgi:hypothetical protein